MGTAPRIPFTVTGRMLGIALAMSFLAAAEASLAQIISFLFWLLVIALCGGWLYRPRLRAELDQTNVLFEGDPFF